MKCVMCGSDKMTTARENVPLVGLPGVTLVGVEVHRCGHCGEHEVVIPRHAALTHIVSRALLNKRGRLCGAEVRWLRSVLGFTGVELAKHMGVTAESVSKWENDRMAMGRVADRLLRLLVARSWPAHEYPLEPLRELTTDEAPSLCLRLRHTSGDWQLDGQLDPGLLADPTSSRWQAA